VLSCRTVLHVRSLEKAARRDSRWDAPMTQVPPKARRGRSSLDLINTCLNFQTFEVGHRPGHARNTMAYVVRQGTSLGTLRDKAGTHPVSTSIRAFPVRALQKRAAHRDERNRTLEAEDFHPTLQDAVLHAVLRADHMSCGRSVNVHSCRALSTPNGIRCCKAMKA